MRKMNARSTGNNWQWPWQHKGTSKRWNPGQPSSSAASRANSSGGGWQQHIPGGHQGRQGGQEPVTRSPRGGDMSVGCSGTKQMRHLDVFPLLLFPSGESNPQTLPLYDWKYLSWDPIILQVSWFSGSCHGKRFLPVHLRGVVWIIPATAEGRDTWLKKQLLCWVIQK